MTKTSGSNHCIGLEIMGEPEKFSPGHAHFRVATPTLMFYFVWLPIDEHPTPWPFLRDFFFFFPMSNSLRKYFVPAGDGTDDQNEDGPGRLRSLLNN